MIHTCSGPVIGGVLRGEKARFQLFGDTMNTASRIESTGVANRIHTSQETAELILDAGKGSWLTQREDKVHAKGKGVITTYWLELESGGTNRSATGMDSSQHTYQVSNNSDDPDNMLADVFEFDNKTRRLINWNCEVLQRLLKHIIFRRESFGKKKCLNVEAIETNFLQPNETKMVIDEVKEIITLPMFDPRTASHSPAENIVLDDSVWQQLQMYVTEIASLYRDNPFHNFEHASHVTMSVVKLLSRIVAPSEADNLKLQMENKSYSLHDNTYGITSDPLTQFACVLSALIHDLDHPGVPNAQLVNENHPLASRYNNKSVAEQNSVDLAWGILFNEKYKDLRAAIYSDEVELMRFRSLVVNSVMATDIIDKDLKDLRNARWDKAFKKSPNSSFTDDEHVAVNRKATIVIEHLIQASDVAHTMQHWHIYRKWNQMFFEECYRAYKSGRATVDPSSTWYKGEIGFFDFYIIPLAKKLKDCGVFGVSSDEYLNYALKNRAEWEMRGLEIVNEMIDHVLKGE
jgi:3'5'-cyclic nucleotide phosphodiesterase/Adenylate and Guanylate cyclase catalytic domain